MTTPKSIQNFPGYPSYFHPRIDIGNGTVTQAIPFTSTELTDNLYKKSPSICSTPNCSLIKQSPANNFFKSNFYVYGAILSGSQSLQYDSTTPQINKPWTCDDGIYSYDGGTRDECMAGDGQAGGSSYVCTPWQSPPEYGVPNVWNNKLINPEVLCYGCANPKKEDPTITPSVTKMALSCGGQSVGPVTNIGSQSCNIFCPLSPGSKTLSYPIIQEATTIPQPTQQSSGSIWAISSTGKATCEPGVTCSRKPTCAININPQYTINCGNLSTQNTFRDNYNFPSSCTLGSSGVGKCYQPQTNSSTGPDYSGDTCLLQPSTKGAPENWSPKYVDDQGNPLPTADNSGAIQCAYGAPVGMFQLRIGTKHDLWMRNFNWASTTLKNPEQVSSFIKDIVKGGKS